jgi:hypothetical protein
MNIGLPLKTKTFLPYSLLLSALLLLFALPVLGQQPDTVQIETVKPEKALRKLDLRRLNRGGYNYWQDDFKGHWAGLDLGFNMLIEPDYSGYTSDFMEIDVFRSNSAYFNLIQQSISLQRNRNTIGLVTGIGLHMQSYRFLDDNTTIIRDDNGKIQPSKLYFEENQKSKLALFSLQVPLLAEFQIPLDSYNNRIYISAGLYGSLRLNSHTKVKSKLERREKLKVVDHFTLQDASYGLMVRTGYRGINVFATYDLLPLFKEGRGPRLTPVSFGITLIRF